jgi:hypothetical protein
VENAQPPQHVASTRPSSLLETSNVRPSSAAHRIPKPGGC